MSSLDKAATEHMRTQDIYESEPVRVERAFIAGYVEALRLIKKRFAGDERAVDVIEFLESAAQ
jgi:hypothetical protein